MLANIVVCLQTDSFTDRCGDHYSGFFHIEHFANLESAVSSCGQMIANNCIEYSSKVAKFDTPDLIQVYINGKDMCWHGWDIEDLPDHEKHLAVTDDEYNLFEMINFGIISVAKYKVDQHNHAIKVREVEEKLKRDKIEAEKQRIKDIELLKKLKEQYPDH